MAKNPIDIARQLSNDKNVSGSQTVADVARKLNEGQGKPLDISKTKSPLEGSVRKGKK
jgi:hypothetical protein